MSRKIDVILMNDLKGKGKMGEIVSVLEGYARNYLFPNGIAKIASNQAIKELEIQKEIKELKIEEEIKEAKKTANNIEGKSIDIYMNAGESGKLFGSVTSKDIADALFEKFSISIDKHKIQYISAESEEKRSIDTFGNYPYEIRLYQGVIAKINVNVCEKEKVN